MPVITEPIPRIAGTEPPPPLPPGGDDFPRGGGGGSERSSGIYRTGIYVALAPIVMLFAGFASAYIVRRGFSNDWESVDLPGVLWLNTAFLLASSVTLEYARRRLKPGWGMQAGYAAAGRLRSFWPWWAVTTALGVAFLLGQLLAWWQLAARGVYLATNPSSSFFYLFTAAHGLHLLGGECALFYVALRRNAISPARLVPAGAATLAARPRVPLTTAVEVTAIYWHFLGVLWLVLFVLLLRWR